MFKYSLFFILIVSCVKVKAQTTITGKLNDINNKALAYGTITIENPLDSSIIDYAISDEYGNYNISLNSALKKILIRMKMFGYDTQTVLVKNTSQTVNLVAKANAITLKEVNIKQLPIIKRSDTLSYNLNSFANSQDRTLGDVLKKIPGIDVSENGQIKYQGRAINKFYVEGKDLMEGSYGIITNSLPNLDVTTIDVLKNHQPVKMLKDKVYSPDAAINVKLKKNITVTGRGDLGVGVSPFLWQVKLTPMVFNKKYQALFSYKTNNIGEDIKTELDNLGITKGIESMSEDNTIGKWLSLAQANLPAIDQKRYLFNQTHAGSVNLLFNIGNDFEMKTNISYINDKLNRQGINYTIIKQYDNAGNVLPEILVSRNSKTDLNNERLNAQFSLTKNTPTKFLKNNLIFQRDNNTDFGYLNLNSLPVNQMLNSPSYSLQNSFSTILPLSKNKILSVQSFLNYANDKQAYVVSPLSALNFANLDFISKAQLNQYLHSQKLNTINSIATSLSLKNLTITPRAELELNENKLDTKLLSKDVNNNEMGFSPDYQNDINYFSLIGKGIVEINYINDNLKIKSVSPLKWNYVNTDDLINIFNRNVEKLTFEPSVFADYRITPNWKVTSSGSIGNQFSPIESLYPGNLFSNLDFSAFKSDIDQIKFKNLNSSIIYESVLTNVFVNASYSFSQQKNNIIINTKILATGQSVMETLNQKNSSNTAYYNLNISKFFPNIKTNVGFGYSYNTSERRAYVNNNLTPIKNYGQSIRFKLSYNQLNWLGLNYRLVLSNNKQKNFNNVIKSNRFLQNLEAFILPIKQHSITFIGDYSSYELNGQDYSNPFLDLKYQYTVEKRKIDFEIKWSNIFNTKTSEEINIGNIQIIQTLYKIRPSQLLLSVKFNFR
jgi:hypothetical protein